MTELVKYPQKNVTTMGLSEQIWKRVEQIAKSKALTFKQLALGMHRHENTFGNWKKQPGRVKLSDLEKLTVALGVTSQELLQEQETPLPLPSQLTLPFEKGSKKTFVEIECTGETVVLRSPHSDSSQS